MEDFSETRYRSEISAISFSHSPKSLISDVTTYSKTGTHPVDKRKKHISFNTPMSECDSKSTSVLHSHGLYLSSTPLPRYSLNNHLDPGKKENSLKRLKEKLNKITEELDTARDTKGETAREGYLYEKKTVEADDLIEDHEFKGFPVLRWCAFCAKETTTEIFYKNSTKTFLSSLGIFLTGGFLGCFLLPYVGSTCKQMSMVCHACKHEIGLVH